MQNKSLIGQALKGSKRMMQIAVSQSCRPIINSALGDKLTWLSPIEKNSFKEFQLNNKFILKSLGISPKNKGVFSFWPNRQPQWDGLALGEDDTLYLFEAKSHLKETNAKCKSSSEQNKKLILNSIRETARKVYDVKDDKLIEKYWLNKYYQLGNRLIFLQKMKDVSTVAANYKSVKLVLLNFVNDYTIKDKVTDATKWDEHFAKIFQEMGISREKVENEGVVLLNYSVHLFTNN